MVDRDKKLDVFLASLSQAELLEAKNKITLLLESPVVDADTTFFYNLILAEVKPIENASTLSMLKQRNKRIYTAILELKQGTDTLFNRFAKEKSKRNRLLFYTIMLRQIISFLVQCNLPVTLKTVLVQKGNLYSILDNAFPGYITSGLFDMLFFTSGGSDNE